MAPALERLARRTDGITADAASTHALRLGVIDAFGCILAGSAMPVAQHSRAAAIEMGISQGPSQVFGSGLRVPRAQAAFLNAVAGHATEFDDWEIPGNTHPSVVLLPALLAAGSEVSGADLGAGYLAGFEAIARLGEVVNYAHYDAGWHSTATLGAIGSAAAVARLLSLGPARTAQTMAIACSRASGFTAQFGSEVKALQAGFAAEAGVTAAFMAKAGITAQTGILDHPRGFAALTGAEGASFDGIDRDGPPMLGVYGLGFKAWPTCGYTHRLMTAALELSPRPDPDRIARIDMHLPDFHAAILPFGDPADRAEALFSLPFVIVMALVHGGVSPADLEAERWRDPGIRRLVALCHVHPFEPANPKLNYDPDQPDRIEVTMTDGSVVAGTCAYPLGSLQNPMSDTRILDKFRDQTGLGPEAVALLGWPEAEDAGRLLASADVAH